MYNNVVYLGPTQNLPLLSFNEWAGGNAENTHFYNNIFFVEGRATYQWGKSRNNIFENNVFFGNHVNRPDDPHALATKPPLLNPGSGRDGFASLAGYRLGDAAEPIRGKVISNNGGRDFFGGSVSADRPPCVGVFER